LSDSVRILAFDPRDQSAARSLILEGLAARWSFLDESRNPDLDDIGATYAHGYFACAWRDGALIATGGFRPLPQEERTVEIHRVSVASSDRRLGVGRAVVTHLLEEARARGFARAVLETTETWADAIELWQRNGFRLVGRRDGEAHFDIDLQPTDLGAAGLGPADPEPADSGRGA